jgi:hypothetical protein
VLSGIALAIRLTSRGPAFFRQTRIGKDGREFTTVKYRTMMMDAEAHRAALAAQNERAEDLLFKIRKDSRVTPVGRVLRRYSLDELPQLINVLTGGHVAGRAWWAAVRSTTPLISRRGSSNCLPHVRDGNAFAQPAAGNAMR